MENTNDPVPYLLTLTCAFHSAPTQEIVSSLLTVCETVTKACRRESVREDVAAHDAVKKALVPLLDVTMARVVSREVMGIRVEESVWLGLKAIADMELLTLAQEVLRCMRNACPGSRANQVAVVGGHVPERICAMLSVMNKVMAGSDKWNEGLRLLANLGLQVMCNVVVENSVTRKVFQDRRYAKDLLSAALDNEAVGFKLLRLCLLLINTCAAEESYCRTLVLPSEVKELSGVLQVARLSNPELFQGQEGKVDDGDGEAAATFEVCSWIVSKIVEAGAHEEALAVLDQEDIAVFLSVWLYYINADTWRSSGPEAMAWLVQYYVKMVTSEERSFKPLVLRILATYSAQDISYDGDHHDQSKLLRCVLAELETGCDSFGYKSELMRVLANVCMRRRVNQDFVRSHNNGILTVLNNVNVDDNNPFMREWGVFAIRNLCEGNADNQQLIRELRVQGVADNGVLEKAGLSVELTSDGKPKVVKRKAKS